MRERQRLIIPFPIKGIDEGRAHSAQPEGTTRDVQNMRAFDPLSGRARGGQRAGLTKYVSSQISGSNRIQDINQVTTTGNAFSQTSLTSRTITAVAVCDGDVAKFTSSAVTAATNGTNALSATAPIIFSAELFGQLYFADGTNAKYYDPATNAVNAWTASVGTFPSNGSNLPRLIELWRGRIVQAGVKGDEHNWFMSRQGDATDYDYDADGEETQAVSGNQAGVGKIGDPINCIIPYSNDVLIFGCDHSIWMLSGDPMALGRIDLVSDITGMAWGRPWCQDPQGVIYFFGSRGGVYRMVPGRDIQRLTAAAPDRITAGRLDERLSTVDLSKSTVRMAWNDREVGVHLFITPIDVTTTAFHYFYDVRTDSWWIDRFGSENHSPVAVHTFDGDDPGDRVLLLGTANGYVNKWDIQSATDDGTAIESHVLLGPIQPGAYLPFVLSELQGVLASGSSDVDFEVYVGNSAEHVFAAENNRSGFLQLISGGRLRLQDNSGYLQLVGSSADFSGTLSAVRSVVHNPRKRGCAAYILLKNYDTSERWSLENLAVTLSTVVSASQRKL